MTLFKNDADSKDASSDGEKEKNQAFYGIDVILKPNLSQ
jgi:hypothetical protein